MGASPKADRHCVRVQRLIPLLTLASSVVLNNSTLVFQERPFISGYEATEAALRSRQVHQPWQWRGSRRQRQLVFSWHRHFSRAVVAATPQLVTATITPNVSTASASSCTHDTIEIELPSGCRLGVGADVGFVSPGARRGVAGRQRQVLQGGSPSYFLACGADRVET